MSFSEQNFNQSAQQTDQPQQSREQPRIVLGCPILQPDHTFIYHVVLLATHQAIKGYCFPEVALLPFARNKVIQQAYQNQPDFTHLLFIDDDMAEFTIEHIVRLWKHNVDVVSGLCVQRKPPYKIVANFPEEDIVKNVNEQRLVETPFVGLAFTLITRRVLDSIQEETNNGPIWITMDRSPRSTYEEEKEKEINNFIEDLTEIEEDNKEAKYNVIRYAIEFGENNYKGTEIIGEDIAFSRVVKKAGFKMYIDCGCLIGHIGNMTFDLRHTLQMAGIPAESKVVENEPNLKVVSAD